MIVAARQAFLTSVLLRGKAPKKLSLLVCGSARDGQIVRLSAAKCTIGSGEGCTLRLVSAGVRAVECVILRGSHGTAIRACTKGVRLNGQPFGDAKLAIGDRLSVGPIEFEVVEGAAPSAADAN